MTRPGVGTRGQAGFTLVEVILAMTILALIMSVLWGSFFSQVRVESAARSETETDQAARLTLELIGRDLTGLVRPSSTPSEEVYLGGETLLHDLLLGHRLKMITRSRSPETGPEPATRVEYWTEPAAGESGPLHIFRSQAPLLSRTEVIPELLCRRVRELKILYLDRAANELESWSDPAQVPGAVDIRLVLEDGRGGQAAYRLTTGPLVGLAWTKGGSK